MVAAGVTHPETLRELEGHLREDIAALVSSGTPQDQAFSLAVARLGPSGSVATEFRKLKDRSSVPLALGLLLLAGMMVAGAMELIKVAQGLSSGMTFLLAAHILTLTAGYGAAYLIGGFGIYYICRDRFYVLSPASQYALRRAVYVFSHISAGLVAAGLVLGMFWSKQNLGFYFGAGGAREAGAWCAAAWLIALCLIQRSGQLSDRKGMLLGVTSNVIISMAWFGAGIVSGGRGIQGLVSAHYWPLHLFVGLNLLILAADGLRLNETAKA